MEESEIETLLKTLSRPPVLASIIFGVCIVVAAVILKPKAENTEEPPPLSKTEKIENIELYVGAFLSITKHKLGEPDRYEKFFIKENGNFLNQYATRRTFSDEYFLAVEKLEYGAFGVDTQSTEQKTKYRLTLYFLHGELYKWLHDAP